MGLATGGAYAVMGGLRYLYLTERLRGFYLAAVNVGSLNDGGFSDFSKFNRPAAHLLPKPRPDFDFAPPSPHIALGSCGA